MKIFFSSRLFFSWQKWLWFLLWSNLIEKSVENGLWKWFLHHTQAILIPAKCVVLLRNGKSKIETFFCCYFLSLQFFFRSTLSKRNFPKISQVLWLLVFNKDILLWNDKKRFENEEIILFIDDGNLKIKVLEIIVRNFQRQCKRIDRMQSSLLMKTFFFWIFFDVRTKIICSIAKYKFTCLETISNKTELSSRNETMKWLSCEKQNKLWNYGNDWLLSYFH